MLGSVENVIVCRPSEMPVAPCTSGAPVVVSAYLVVPSAQAQLDSVIAPVDFTEAGQFWALSFAFVVAIWSTSHMFRSVQRAIH